MISFKQFITEFYNPKRGGDDGSGSWWVGVHDVKTNKKWVIHHRLTKTDAYNKARFYNTHPMTIHDNAPRFGFTKKQTFRSYAFPVHYSELSSHKWEWGLGPK